MAAQSKYIHTEVDHTLADPQQLVPLFRQLFSPVSVCDVGCGTGNFLHVFKQNGAQTVLGLDGDWANREIISKHLAPAEFQPIDFENISFVPPQFFDLCLCLEVAEHVSDESSTAFVTFLTSISATIIFSAALPYQGGINHINEQKEEYWERKFAKLGYRKYDLIRHRLHKNKKISPHYRRNIVVYSRNDLSGFPQVPFGQVAIQENCQQRLYIDFVQGNLRAAKLSAFLLKLLLIKMSPKKLLVFAKRLRRR